jgi:hypothetical protein
MFGENIYWKSKLLIFTWHFKEEFDLIGKPIEFVKEILVKGDHHLIAKKQNKYNVFHPYQRQYLCLSYVEHENIILIHIKPINKKLNRKIK